MLVDDLGAILLLDAVHRAEEGVDVAGQAVDLVRQGQHQAFLEADVLPVGLHLRYPVQAQHPFVTHLQHFVLEPLDFLERHPAGDQQDQAQQAEAQQIAGTHRDIAKGHGYSRQARLHTQVSVRAAQKLSRPAPQPKNQ